MFSKAPHSIFLIFVTAAFLSGSAAANRTYAETSQSAATQHRYITVDGDISVPQQIGKAAFEIDENAPDNIGVIAITPVHHGIKGRTVEIVRADIKRAIERHHGSAEEIWRHVAFRTPPEHTEEKNGLQQPPFSFSGFKAGLILDNRIGRQARTDGLSYRTSLQAGFYGSLTPHILFGGDVRLNIADNLRRTQKNSGRAVRRNVHDFASRTVGADRLYISWLGSAGKDTSFAVTAGYLEEMYGGFGGEVLYRPFRKTYAIGLEGYRAYKRTASRSFDMGFTGDSVTSYHLKGWYEIPHTDITLHGRIGRYLAGDKGGTVAVQKRMDNGIYAEASVTATSHKDDSILTDSSHIAGRLGLHVPFRVFYKEKKSGSLFTRSGISGHIETIGRDAGQIIAPPLSLYDITAPLSYRHLGNHWPSLLH